MTTFAMLPFDLQNHIISLKNEQETKDFAAFVEDFKIWRLKRTIDANERYTERLLVRYGPTGLYTVVNYGYHSSQTYTKQNVVNIIGWEIHIWKIHIDDDNYTQKAFRHFRSSIKENYNVNINMKKWTQWKNMMIAMKKVMGTERYKQFHQAYEAFMYEE